MRIGIDLGGTKTEIAVLDERGVIGHRRRVATPADYDAIVRSVVALVHDAEAAHGRTCTVGLGIPGSIGASGLVRNANTVCLNGKPLGRDLDAALGRPVRVANDANCFALSEATDGAARGAAIVFGVIVGTGCGGGLVVNGALVGGHQGITGEWGHNPLPWATGDELPGPRCWCGKQGCLEVFLSGPAIARDHGGGLDAASIAAAAEAGDVACRATLDRHADRLTRALGCVVNVVDPDVIVLGGGVGQIAGLAEHVERALVRWVFADAVSNRVVRPLHGDSSGVRGAAWLWDR
jgi:fructokinase